MKLGKRAPFKNRDALKFGDFLTALPTAPLVDPTPAYSYPMDDNDTIGDCVVAGFDHFNQIITGLLTGTQQHFTNDQILAFYKTQNPNYPAEDNGMNIQTFLEYLQTNKYILGFAKVDYTNPAELQAAIYIGLCLMCGVQLQQAQETQFSEGQLWNPVSGSPIIGGHCPPLAGYFTQTDIYSMITWGKIQNCTQQFITEQMDECWFVLTQAHIDHPNFRDNFNLAGFAEAVSEITNGQIKINTMPSVTITRQPSTATETLGQLITSDGEFGCKTLELPWKNDQLNISCVPPGTYTCVWKLMLDLGEWHYELQGTAPRSGIFIHEGNSPADTKGCILLGGLIQGEDIVNSKEILAVFEAKFAHNPFILHIV